LRTAGLSADSFWLSCLTMTAQGGASGVDNSVVNGFPWWRLAVVIDDWPLFRLGLQAVLEPLGVQAEEETEAVSSPGER
jgi:hypothetical protein